MTEPNDDRRQKCLDLGQRAALCLVEQHKGILLWPAAHDFERNQFDIATLQRDLIGSLADPQRDRV